MYNSLIKKLFLTLGILFFYKTLTYFPLPGVNLDLISRFFMENQNNMFGMADLFSGGAVSRMSFVTLGVMPYITAAILMELFAHFDSNIGALKKEKDGITKFIQYTRYLTILIATVQSFGVIYGVTQMGEGVVTISTLEFFIIGVPLLVTGTIVLMWLGEQISQYGIGNGISLIIFAAIVSGVPSGLVNTLELFNNGTLSFLVIIAIVILIITTVCLIIFIEKGERRLPLQYTSTDRTGNFLPLKLNLANVIPAIFAGALISIPGTISMFLSEHKIVTTLNDFIAPGTIGYNLLTFFLIFGFTYFYAKIAFKSDEVTKNLSSSGGFIPGIRPGEQTKEYLDKIVSKLTFFSGVYLGLIATIPWIIMEQLGTPFYFGGISTLVIVQVTFDFITKLSNEIKSVELKTNEQKTFL